MKDFICKHLRRFSSFFLKNESGWQSSLKFAVGTFLFETLMAAFIFAQVSSKVRFKGFFSFENAIAAGVVIYFFARVFLLHLVFGFFLRILEATFDVRSKKTLYFLFVLYAYMLIAIRYPQNFDELPWLLWIFKESQIYKAPWILGLPVICIFILLLSSVLRSYPKKIAQWGMTLLVLGGVFLLLKESSQPLFPIENVVGPEQTPLKKEKPNIIFVTVDSLRGDVDLGHFVKEGRPLKDYLSESIHFHRVVSPLAQTHAALASLFLGKTPGQTGFRTNLSDQGLKLESLLKEGLLGALKDSGYEIRMAKDQEEYENFSVGSVMERVKSPSFPIANVIISTFFKNRIVYGLFDNPLGYLLLPEIKDNTSFIYSYDLRRFTKSVFDELDDVNKTEKPVFLYIHTCSMHWPGVLPYPYYPQEDFPKHSVTPFSYTSKFRGLSQEKLGADEWNAQADFNRKIYQSGTAMTVQDFLDPVFAKIRQAGLDKNSIVVLLSDHGEDLWDSSSRFPKDKMVQHGTSLIFGSSSEISFLRMKIPGQSFREVKQNVGIIDILPTVMDYAHVPYRAVEGHSLKPFLTGEEKESERFYYTETGLWPFAMFRGQFTTVPANELGPLFKVDSSAKIYIDPQFLPGIIQQKQRAVYYGPYRFTTYPTMYGYMDFLCDRSKDFACTKNLVTALPQIAGQMKTAINGYFSEDIQKGLLKAGACSPFKSSSSMEFANIKEYQWQYYFQALECLRGYHDYRYTTKIFDLLLKSDEVGQTLKSRIKRSVLSLCANANAFSQDNFSSYLKNDIKSQIENGLKVALPSLTRRCLESLGEGKLASRIEYASEEADVESVDEEAPTPGSRRELWALLQKYSGSQGEERTRLWHEVVAHPKAKFFKTSLDVAQVYEDSRKDLNVLNEKLDSYFEVELNYDLADYLETYYFAKLKNLLAKDKNQALTYMLKQLASKKALPLSYYNFVLYKIDEIIPSKKPGELTSLRFRAGSVFDKSESPQDWRRVEVSLALVKGRQFLCAQKVSDSCRDIANLAKVYQADLVLGKNSYLIF